MRLLSMTARGFRNLPDGERVEFPGWMFTLACAMRDLDWALEEVITLEFEKRVRDWLRDTVRKVDFSTGKIGEPQAPYHELQITGLPTRSDALGLAKRILDLRNRPRTQIDRMAG